MGLFSQRADAVPILFLHGWPGSFLEFMGLFSEAARRYSADQLPFHMIAPSLIGYTLSSGPPQTQDWSIYETARVMQRLMERLGFGEEGYVAQGGDLGSYTSQVLAAQFESCKAIHCKSSSSLGTCGEVFIHDTARGFSSMTSFVLSSHYKKKEGRFHVY